ncbi:hypothetical protein HHI36_022441 [Cryptolaemus montrouzieri]|uniref:Phorbol-ester/DAG-type domain-containing protein n=1 Tax=Cryptolaemus montrouzieri TaxID=559131 RepID=A0ABD2N0K5_9CUCU
MRNFKMRLQYNPQVVVPHSTGSNDCCSSTHSQDGSSIYGNYFVRHANHGTPFDSGLDETIIDEDILADENDASGYFSEESEDESEEIKKDSDDETNKNGGKFKMKPGDGSKNKQAFFAEMAPCTVTDVSHVSNVCKYCGNNAITNIIECANCSISHHKRCAEKKDAEFSDCGSKLFCCKGNENDDDLFKDSILFTAEAFAELETKGIVKKNNTLEAFLVDKIPDVLCITEHFLNDKFIDDFVLDEWKKAAVFERESVRQGGVTVFCKGDFEVIESVNSLCTGLHCEVTAIRVTAVDMYL